MHAVEKTNLLQTYLNIPIAYKTSGDASAWSPCRQHGQWKKGTRKHEKESSKSDEKSRKCDLRKKGEKQEKV